MAKDVKKKRKNIDWESIEREYRAGQLSNSELARVHSITPAAISLRSKRKGWKKDLAKRVVRAVKEKLVTIDVTEANASDNEIVTNASDRGVAVVMSHRQDIAKLRALEEQLIKEVFSSPKKTWVGQYQGEIVTHDFDITATERSSAAQSLSTVQHKRIQLERQAYNLDDDGGDVDLTPEQRDRRIDELIEKRKAPAE